MGGFNQPIKLGSRDYVIAGYAAELLAFFDCFKDYDVIGSALAQDGHWYPGNGTLKIQLQNLNTNSQGLNAELWEMVFKISIDRIIKFLNPKEIINSKQALIFGSKAAKTVGDIEKAISKLKQWLPGAEKYAKKIVELIESKKDLDEKIREFLEFVQKEEEKKNALRKKWIGLDNVDKEQKMVVMLTMYEKPENRVRATFDMGKARVKVSDIGDALKVFLRMGD